MSHDKVSSLVVAAMFYELQMSEDSVGTDAELVIAAGPLEGINDGSFASKCGHLFMFRFTLWIYV
jgi:hypothetical protein